MDASFAFVVEEPIFEVQLTSHMFERQGNRWLIPCERLPNNAYKQSIWLSVSVDMRNKIEPFLKNASPPKLRITKNKVEKLL